jgi:hypothetical protein
LTPNSYSPSILRYPFLYCFLLLALLLVGTAGLAARARLEARRSGAVPAAEIPPAPGAASAAVGIAGPTVKNGRVFAGFYEEVSATDLGESFYVYLKFQIFNYSDAGLNDATVRLTNPSTNESNWSLAGVSIEDRRGVVLTADFTVLRPEYEYWQKGGTPHLLIEYRNGQGEDERRTIELARMPIGEVQ